MGAVAEDNLFLHRTTKGYFTTSMPHIQRPHMRLPNVRCGRHDRRQCQKPRSGFCTPQETQPRNTAQVIGQMACNIFLNTNFSLNMELLPGGCSSGIGRYTKTQGSLYYETYFRLSAYKNSANLCSSLIKPHTALHEKVLAHLGSTREGYVRSRHPSM